MYCARCNALQEHEPERAAPDVSILDVTYRCSACQHPRTRLLDCAHIPTCVVNPATRGANTTGQMQAAADGRRRVGIAAVVGLCLVLLCGVGGVFYLFNPAGLITGGAGGGASPSPTVAVTSAKAGAGVPVVLALDGNRGAHVIASGYPKTRVVDCRTFAERPNDKVVPASPGATTVQYNAKTGHYGYTWKTQKAWSGACRELIFKFGENVAGLAGGELVMYFRFT